MVTQNPDNPFAPKLRGAGDFPEQEFTEFANVPIFAEHETTDKRGRKLKFGLAELNAVAERCNRRISETGDYAAVSLGHTPSPDAMEQGQAMPEIVGFAGPFRVGQIGDGSRKRYAILADMHIFRDDVGRVRKHPRRSPELWLEDRYEEMFLDPIALLGAEAPRLDLGLLYSATRNGRQVEKYTAVAPSASNVFIPDDDAEKYQQDPAGPTVKGATMLGPDDIRQIVDALEQLDWVQGVKHLLSTQEAPGEGGAGMGDAEPGIGGSVDLAQGQPPVEPTLSPPAAPVAPPEAGPPLGDDAGAPAPELPAEASPEGPPVAPPEEDPERMRRYAAADEMDDDEFDTYCQGRSAKKNYAAEGTASGNEPEVNSGVVDGDAIGPNGDGSVEDDDGKAATTYESPSGSPAKYSRMLSQIKKLESEVSTNKQEVERERSARVDAERLQVLYSLQHSGFTIDPVEQIERCNYSKMTSEQFDAEVEFIHKSVTRVPFTDLPTSNAFSNVDDDAYRPGANASRERYAKEESKAALKICEAKAIAGHEVNYEEELEKIRNGKPASV